MRRKGDCEAGEFVYSGQAYGARKGLRECGVTDCRQTRGCPRNCKRKVFVHEATGKSGKAGVRRSIREPGDLPRLKTNWNGPRVEGERTIRWLRIPLRWQRAFLLRRLFRLA